MLTIEHLPRQPLPAGVTPMLVAVRPNATDDPTVEPMEESSDVGTFVVLAPTPQEWIKFCDQLLSSQRSRSVGSLPHLVHETAALLRLGIRIQRTLSGLATNLALGQIVLSIPALDKVAEELEAIPDMDNPRLLRM